MAPLVRQHGCPLVHMVEWVSQIQARAWKQDPLVSAYQWVTECAEMEARRWHYEMLDFLWNDSWCQ